MKPEYEAIAAMLLSAKPQGLPFQASNPRHAHARLKLAAPVDGTEIASRRLNPRSRRRGRISRGLLTCPRP